MVHLDLDVDEAIVLENSDVIWVSREYTSLDNLVLTNKRIYCLYQKSNGLFRKSSDELCSFNLSDIKIIHGQAQVQFVKYEGDHCLQIQLLQGREIFEIFTSPKKTIPQWVEAINSQLGTSSQNPIPRKSINPFSHTFSSSVEEIMNKVQFVSEKAAPLTQKNERVCTTSRAGLKTNADFCTGCGEKRMQRSDSRSTNFVRSYFDIVKQNLNVQEVPKSDSAKQKTYRFTVKSRVFSLGSVATAMASGHIPKNFDVSTYYKVFDCTGAQQYTVKVESNLTDRNIYNVYDSTGKRVGRIKEHLFSVGVPLLEKETKKCSVYFDNEKICELKKFEMFGEKHFEVLEGDFHISYDQKDNFKISCHGNRIVSFQIIPYKLKELFRDAFVDKINLVCYENEKEALSILLSIAINVICV
ncbi:MAG: hypothetical protein Q4F17_07985 [Eubacteriales bacterium]|nr:hypothetical protein [Eubacteriales bacterium]